MEIKKMEVQYVREFLTLVKYGNYLAAADELFISQSTLSLSLIHI